MALAKNSTLGSGFRLEIGLAEIHVPRMWVEKHPEVKESQVNNRNHYCALCYREIIGSDIFVYHNLWMKSCCVVEENDHVFFLRLIMTVGTI